MLTNVKQCYQKVLTVNKNTDIVIHGAGVLHNYYLQEVFLNVNRFWNYFTKSL